MMKSMSENSNGSNSNTSSSNWLGFSLYPNIKMEVAPSSSPLDVEASNSMLISPLQHLTCSPAQCFSGYAEATAEHGLAATSSSSPKLENFLGAANHEREAMSLSLDSIYYPQNGHNPQEANGQSHSLDLFQHHQPFYGDGDGDDLFQAPMVEPGLQKGTADISDCNAQISEMANWVTIATMADNGSSSPASGSIASVACGDLQSLTLSMSPGCHSSCVIPIAQISPSPADCLAMGTKKRGFGKMGQKLPLHRKSIDTFGQRTSQYRGVTKHRWTGRYEAHLWDNSCKKEGQTRKGRQVYLGGYDMEDKAARAYDLAALKYWGPSTHTNFPVENYKDQLEEMNNMTRQEYVAHLRRKSSGFSRGASMYRGVTRHHQHGRWQARIGRVAGNKDLYLGTFSAQEEAAEAYDIAAIKFRGVSAVTNFDMSRYDVEKIMSSNTLLAGEQAKRIKALDASNSPIDANPISSPQLVLYDYPHQEEQNNFSVALHDLIGTHLLNSTMVDECNKMASVQVSNASSIVTSLNSSREGSPDKSGSSSNVMVIQKPPKVGWISPAQLRPATAIPMAYLPVFSAWNDA